MKYSIEKLENVYAALGADPGKGLSEQQVKEIQAEKGLNVFDDEKKESIPQKVLHHLRDITSLILLAAAGISLYLAFVTDHGFTDPIVILAIVAVATILAVRQEMGAEKALDALKNMHAHMTVVLRDGVKQNIDAKELVPGDILLLSAGDKIPADARIIESINLKVEESVLTGESVPVEKDADAEVPEKAPLGDQTNMLFSECLVTNGKATAVVTATGMNTEMGKIAGLLINTKKERTPLQNRLDALGRMLCIVAAIAAAILFLLELFNGRPVMYILMNAVSLAVAVVPETLPVIVTITLAYGVFNMARRNAIIRKIPAVETLGSASVICSDKTGTLTMNRMTIKRIWASGREPKEAEFEFDHEERVMIEMMGLASNASIEIENGEEKTVGDPTETAIVRLLMDKHITKPSLDAIYPKVFEIPFDSNRKLMTTVHELDDMRYLSITKGAFDRIPVEATAEFMDRASRIHDEFADDALRVIAVAYKYYDELPEILDAGELEHGLVFAGFVGMIDPPRAESMGAVQTAKKAGIRTVMITGDHAATASAIAREIGILSEGKKAVTGAELEAMSDEELFRNVRDYSVYARVSPEDKIRIVQAWQAQGEVVAMTGDGVNDAPALKAANVGVAMGSGTDVSKSASDVILVDDNFASIVDAVAEGRRVYENIRKVLYSLLSCNISEIFILLLAASLGWGPPLVAIQLLLINVVADGVPDLFVCREKAEDDAMNAPPVKPGSSIYANGLFAKIVTMAVLFAVIGLLGFYIGKFVPISNTVAPSPAVGQTMAFVIIGWSSVINIFNVRSNMKSIFTIGFTSNPLLFAGICFSVAFIALIALAPPLMNMFYCVPLGIEHWIVMIAFSVSPLALGEIQKLTNRRRALKNHILLD